MERPDGNLSKAMRQLNGLYIPSASTTCTLLRACLPAPPQGDYPAEGDLPEGPRALRGMVMNPVRARIDRARGLAWSNYRATMCDAPCWEWLRRDWLLSAFDSTEQAAVAASRRFVAEGIDHPTPWEQLSTPMNLQLGGGQGVG